MYKKKNKPKQLQQQAKQKEHKTKQNKIDNETEREQKALRLASVQTYIPFKLCIVTHTTMVYRLISVSMTFTFCLGHRFRRKIKLVQTFCCKVIWSSQNFAMVDYAKKMTAKKSCKHEELRSSEHISFFLLIQIRNVLTWVCIHPANWLNGCPSVFPSMCLSILCGRNCFLECQAYMHHLPQPFSASLGGFE